MRIFKKTVVFLLICGVVLLAGEALYFWWVARQPSDPSSCDAIVVFSGTRNRVQRAWELARQGVAPVLIISPASRRSIDGFEKRFGAPGEATYILEEQAETTFTNALYTARLIRENRFRSVLLVTADYHMPRALLLFNLALLTDDCRVGMFKLDTRLIGAAPGHGQVTRLKMTYNEMLQLWGSLFEGSLHAVGGPNTWLRKRSSSVSIWLREHLLFTVPCLDC